jgi:hypothetical protein
MEPRDLNTSPSDDAQLDELLRRPAPPIPDDGFSDRVLASLPERRRAPALFYRPVLLALGTLAGTIFAANRGSLEALLSPGELVSIADGIFAGASASSLGLALLTTLAALAYALLIDSVSLAHRVRRWRTILGW